MNLLSRDDILGADDLKTETIRIPEWDNKEKGIEAYVKVRTLSAFEADKYEEATTGKNGGKSLLHARARLAAACLVDDDGSQMFTEKDIVKLSKKSSSALDRIFIAVMELNSFDDKDIEQLAKN